MTENAYHSLDTAGVVNDPMSKATRLLGNYLSTNFSQSTIFRNQLLSLSKAVQESANNISTLEGKISSDLSVLYSNYLDGVTIEVSSEPVVDERGLVNDNRYDIQIEIWFLNGGKQCSLVQALRLDGSTISSIAEIIVRN